MGPTHLSESRPPNPREGGRDACHEGDRQGRGSCGFVDFVRFWSSSLPVLLSVRAVVTTLTSHPLQPSHTTTPTQPPPRLELYIPLLPQPSSYTPTVYPSKTNYYNNLSQHTLKHTSTFASVTPIYIRITSGNKPTK